jgi:hypothetical protein
MNVPEEPSLSPETAAAISHGIPVPVARGRHPAPGDEACLMELAAALTGEPWTDHPASVHPVLAAVARAVNDRVSDGARECLSPLVQLMTGTAGTGTGGRECPDRCARLVLLCAEKALELSPFMGAEMESARRTAFSVLSRPAGTGPVPAGQSGTAARRLAAALLDRLGLLPRMYTRHAAAQVTQAVSVIAGASAGQRDAHLCRLLRACTALCAADPAAPAAPAAPTAPAAGVPAASHRGLRTKARTG